MTLLSTAGSFFTGVLPKVATAYFASFPLREVARAVDLYKKSGQVRNLVHQIGKDIAKDSLQNATAHTLQLNKILEKSEKKEKPKLKLGLRPR